MQAPRLGRTRRRQKNSPEPEPMAEVPPAEWERQMSDWQLQNRCSRWAASLEFRYYPKARIDLRPEKSQARELIWEPAHSLEPNQASVAAK